MDLVKMNFCIIYPFIIIVLTLVDAARIINNRNYRDSNFKLSGTFGGARRADPELLNQINKRDISLSYAATNIDSKEGTRVKTITVIKNHSGKNNAKLAINPQLYKNENWANAFRENFDTYGRIPDVPDIDELFDFVKKNTKDGDNKKNAPKPKPTQKPNEVPKTEIPPKPVEEPSSAEIELTTTTEPVKKIKGDAEFIPTLRNNQTNARSQSLGLNNVHTREPLANSNNTSSEEIKDIRFEKYIVQDLPKGYDYPKPCPQGGKSVISIRNPSSGHTYDITVDEDSPRVPYIAPSITRRTQLPASQNNSLNFATTFAQPRFSVNSILPALQPTQINTQQPVGYSPTSQRPYIAPNVRYNYNGNGITTVRPVYGNDLNIYRGNSLLLGAKRVNAVRTRG